MNSTLAEAIRPPFSLQPVAGHIGAEIHGVTLNGDIDVTALTALRQALLQYKVLFVREQRALDDRRQEAFAQRLGQLVAHPTVPSRKGTEYILDLDSEHSRANSWHTDVTFRAAYPAISILRAVILPPAGGDTIWANTARAYQELPRPLQGLVESLHGLHSNRYDYAHGSRNPPARHAERYRQQFISTVYESKHPLVAVHPETGERTLLAGHFLQRIQELDADASQALITQLQTHITRYDNTVRWRWHAGDVAIWDNRATQHYAIYDYGQERRIMRRVTVAGTTALNIEGRPSTERIVPAATAA